MERLHEHSLDFRHSREWRNVVNELELSARESELIECLLDFCDDNDELAARLGISKHTVHSHFKRLYSKLGVGSRCQVLARVLLACFEFHVRSEAAASGRDATDSGGAECAVVGDNVRRMTGQDFRRIVLGLEGAIEGAHMGHPDFRVNGRIVALQTGRVIPGRTFRRSSTPRRRLWVPLLKTPQCVSS